MISSYLLLQDLLVDHIQTNTIFYDLNNISTSPLLQYQVLHKMKLKELHKVLHTKWKDMDSIFETLDCQVALGYNILSVNSYCCLTENKTDFLISIC